MRLTQLTKRFGDHLAVADVNLDVESRQVFGFLGPNGAGKSTTIRLLVGLYLPSSGGCKVLGLDPRDRGVEVRRRIGYLPGDLAMPAQLTGRELLGRIARIRGGVDSVLQDSLARRFRADLDRPLHTLSTGNRQKIGLIQAFMHDPELLILDEPTSGLDPLLQKEFADLLADVVDRGRTVFLSSHDLDEVQRLAHQIAIIRGGRLVLVDTVQGLRERAPRTVELTFDETVDGGAFSRLPGVRVRSATGRHVDLTVEGAVGPLLGEAARLGVVDIVASAAGLDELFQSFYAPNEEARGAR